MRRLLLLLLLRQRRRRHVAVLQLAAAVNITNRLPAAAIKASLSPNHDEQDRRP